MIWPKYFKDRLVVGNPNSDTAIATLWTPMNVLEKMVDISRVSIIGQLYTKRGINYLLRNVFLNPRLTRLLLTGADLMGAGEALLRLSQMKSQISYRDEADWLDENISDNALRDFLKNVTIINKIGPVSQEEVVSFSNESSVGDQWGEVMDFPEPNATGSGGLPSEESLFCVRGEKIWQVWVRLLNQIMRFGRPSPMIHHYGDERITELLNLAAVVYSEDPKKPDLPDWMPYSKEDIRRYVESFLRPSRGDEEYTYGERLKAFPLEGYEQEFLSHVADKGEFRSTLKQALNKSTLDQQRLIVEKLKSFPENKGAIALLWEPMIDNFGLRQIWRTPCLILLQSTIRDGRLYLTGYFRSNDMYGSWPLNMFGLVAFQQEIASMVSDKIKLGALTTISHSAHIYESSWQAAEKLAHDHWQDVACEWDPRGNLNVDIEGDQIIVKHLSPDGIFLDEYREDGTAEYASKQLCFKLESAGLFSTVGNAMYTARQIERAGVAIKLGLSFTSDLPLDFSKIKAQSASRRKKRKTK